MSNNWKGYTAAPIEKFHVEALDRFHELKKFDHKDIEEAFGKPIGTIDGNTFNTILAEFKMKILKEYGISRDPIKTEEAP